MTPENFIGAITGSETLASSGRKVLKSNEESKVFMYLADSGATGLLAFPNMNYLYANEFNKALEKMHDKKMYGEMLVYLEASEAGSIFEDLLPKNSSILVVTATGNDETSFATYCYPDDIVNGKHIGTCLGDTFSVNWMEDSDMADPKVETID